MVYIPKVERYNIEQRYVIKFCVKLEESAKVSFDKVIKVFGDEVVLNFETNVFFVISLIT